MAGRANLGYSKDLTIATREFLHSVEGLEIVPGHFVIDKSKAYDGGNTGREWVIRAGCFMSQNASTKKWVPTKRTRINGTAGSVQAFVVDSAIHFRVGDVITVGADTTKTISAIDYTTNTITVSDAAFTVADNDVVFCETANEGLPEMILMDTVSLRDSDNVTAVDGLGVLASAADVTVESLLGDVASMLADATAKSNIIHKFKLWNSTTQRYSSAGLTG